MSKVQREEQDIHKQMLFLVMINREMHNQILKLDDQITILIQAMTVLLKEGREKK